MVCLFAERRKMLKAGRVAAREMERPAGEGAPTFYSTEQSQSDKLNVEPGVHGVSAHKLQPVLNAELYHRKAYMTTHW